MTNVPTPEYLGLTKMAIIFEACIIFLLAILLALSLRRYLKKKNKMTMLLSLTFLMLFIGIIFSWLAKYLYYYHDAWAFSLETTGYWFISRVEAFHFTFGFIILGTFISYIFKENLFEESRNKARDIIYSVFGVLSFTFSIITPQGELFDTITFVLGFVYMLMVYLPFSIHTMRAAKTLDKGKFKTAFIYLSIMALCMLGIFLNFMLDNVYNFATAAEGEQKGYSIFYYLGWILALVGMWGAYFGYIKPSQQK